MATVSYASLHPGYADDLIRNQRRMTKRQREICINHPHMLWVNPRVRNLPQPLRMSIYLRDDGICAYCNSALPDDDFTIDHVQPVCKGGGDEPENLTVACRSCNSSKGGK